MKKVMRASVVLLTLVFNASLLPVHGQLLKVVAIPFVPEIFGAMAEFVSTAVPEGNEHLAHFMRGKFGGYLKPKIFEVLASDQGPPIATAVLNSPGGIFFVDALMGRLDDFYEAANRTAPPAPPGLGFVTTPVTTPAPTVPLMG